MISGDRKLQELINKQNEHLTPSAQPTTLRTHSSGSVPRLADKSPTLAERSSQSPASNSNRKKHRRNGSTSVWVSTPPSASLPAAPLFGPTPRPPPRFLPPRLPPPLPSRTLLPFNAPPAQYPPLQIHTNSLLSPASIQSMYSRRNSYGGAYSN